MAESAPGVLLLITHETAPITAHAPPTMLGPSPPLPFRDNSILQSWIDVVRQKPTHNHASQ
jgi:hypothetical protein